MHAGADVTTSRAARGVLWVFVAMLAGRLVLVAGLAVLARWLAPADLDHGLGPARAHA